MYLTFKYTSSNNPHGSLNSSKGIIFEPDLQYEPEIEILDNLKDQDVTDIYRIPVTLNNKIPTKLTFNKFP